MLCDSFRLLSSRSLGVESVSCKTFSREGKEKHHSGQGQESKEGEAKFQSSPPTDTPACVSIYEQVHCYAEA